MIRHVPCFLRQAFSRLTAQACSKSSSVVSASIQCSEPTDKGAEHTTAATNEKLGKSNESGVDDSNAHDLVTRFRQARSSIVAAAFASLKEDEESPVPGPKGKGPQPVKKKKSYVDTQIVEADSVEALLKVAELPSISRHRALRIISVLSEWSASGRVKLADFEGDMRFIKLCHILGKSMHGYQSGTSGFGDLSMVLGVTGEDEAAKLVASISLPQMIKVMSTLAQKRRRSTPLLRSLAFNIGRQEKQLDMKQCADLLYATSVLNFPDDVLLEKVCSDLCECVPTNTNSAVVRSVVTSLGLLRYKHTEVLDVLLEWVAANADNCRAQDLSSLVLTLATVNHTPLNADALCDAVEKHVTQNALLNPVMWLELVWSLFVLDRGSAQLAESVLSLQFLNKLGDVKGEVQEIGTASKLKLLNINACAQLKLQEYSGPLLAEDSDVHRVPLTRSQEKSLLVTAVFDSLSNLLSSSTYLRRDIDTGMGFLLDGECLLDANCNPLPVEEADASSSSKNSQNKKTTRIGIMSLGYRDLCRGALNEPNGVAALGVQLLQKKGYKVLTVPHTDFSPHDKLVRRVQYLEQQLKNVVRSS